MDLASAITLEIRQRGLSPPEAAAALGLTASEVHAILDARIADCSRDQLDQILHSLLASALRGPRSGSKGPSQ